MGGAPTSNNDQGTYFQLRLASQLSAVKLMSNVQCLIEILGELQRVYICLLLA